MCGALCLSHQALAIDIRSLLNTVDELEAPLEKAEYKATPLPSGPDAYTIADWRADRKAFYTRHFIEGYKQHGMRGPEWDGVVIEYLAQMVDYFSGLGPSPDSDEAYDLRSTVIDKGCKDPLILYFHAVQVRKPGERKAHEDRLRESIDQFAKYDGYSKLIQTHPVNLLSALLLEDGESREAEFEKWFLKLSTLVKASLLDHNYVGDEYRFFLTTFNALNGTYNARFGDQAFDLFIQDEALDPWIRHILAGKYYISKAWKSRGGSWGRFVTKDGWEGFRKNLDLARRTLVKAWEMDPSRPEAATLMITVSMAESGKVEPERQWFDRAVEAHFDWKEAYDSYLLAILPRWGGSHRAMYDFAVECAETKRFDTGIPGLFVDTLARIDYDINSTELFRELPETRKHLREVTTGYVDARKDDPEEFDFWRTVYVGIAWKEGEFSRARKMLEEMDGAFRKDKFKEYYKIPWSWARREIFAMTDNCADEIKKAKRFEEDGRFSEAITIYSNAMSSCESRSSRKFAKGKLESAKMLWSFSKEARVQLEPKQGFRGWRAIGGQWRLDTNGWITGSAVKPGLWLVFEQEFPNDIEISGEIVFEDRGEMTNLMAGIAFGLTDPDPQSFAMLLLHKDEDVVSISREDRISSGLRKPLPIEKTNTFKIHIWKRQVVIYVNDKPIHYIRKLNTMLAAETFKIALGSRMARKGTVVKYRNLFVRKLDEDPIKILGTQMLL